MRKSEALKEIQFCLQTASDAVTKFFFVKTISSWHQKNSQKKKNNNWILVSRLRLAGFIARKENEKLACEKFLARNKVQEMREIRGYKFVHFYPFFEPNWPTFHPKKEKKFSSIVGLLISMDYNPYQLIVIGDMELKHFCWCKFWVSLPLNLF